MKEKITSFLLKSETVVKCFFNCIITSFFGVIWIILWIPVAIKISLNISYFPEYKRKSVVERISENIIWVLKYHRANLFYTLYGLDIKGNSSKEYIDEKSFWKGLDRINYQKGHSSQICLLRDKYLFYKYMSSNGMPVPEVFGIIKNAILFDNNFNENNFSTLENEKDYFLKSIDGECASFVKHIKDYNEFLKIFPKIEKGTFILQRTIRQSKKMSSLNPDSINTLRIITVNIDGKPKVLSALLRIGTSATGNVDNWAAGGLAIGIEKDGYLKKDAFYKPEHGLKTDRHPDNGMVFHNFRIPMLNEAFDIACSAHKFFYGVGAIGWDVAITENGPVFVEGNDNFEITLMQACDKPLKNEWMQVCNKWVI